MREGIATHGKKIFLGRCGENMATYVLFDISEWQRIYGDGTAQLIHQRNGDKQPYPCVIEQNDGCVTWNITNSDVAVAGRGRAELQYYVGDVLVKSNTYVTATERALSTASEAPPDPYQSWMDKMLGLATGTEENAEEAERSAAQAKISEEAAANSADNASTSESAARSHLEDTKEQAELATGAADVAKEAMIAAEKARDEAQSIAGGDFATRTEAQGYADTAEENAKKYTDQKIADIPTPDVSGQIDEHNTSDTAHSDIRTAVSNAASAAAEALEAAKTYTGEQIAEHNASNAAHADLHAALADKAPMYTYSPVDITAEAPTPSLGRLHLVYK